VGFKEQNQIRKGVFMKKAMVLLSLAVVAVVTTTVVVTTILDKRSAETERILRSARV
jgi:hypothetical protein